MYINKSEYAGTIIRIGERPNNICPWRYYYTGMCVLICTENAYHANTRQHRQEGGIFPLGIDSGGSPTDSIGDPHRFKRWPPPPVWCGTLLHVALCSLWGIDSRGAQPHRFKRWPPPRVWRGTLFRMALSSIQDPPDSSMIVGFILVIPTPGMLCRTPV